MEEEETDGAEDVGESLEVSEQIGAAEALIQLKHTSELNTDVWPMLVLV